jgi:hypothetical protein
VRLVGAFNWNQLPLMHKQRTAYQLPVNIATSIQTKPDRRGAAANWCKRPPKQHDNTVALLQPFSFLEQLGALFLHGSDASRQSVTHALASLPGPLFTHGAADAFQMLDAAGRYPRVEPGALVCLAHYACGSF